MTLVHIRASTEPDRGMGHKTDQRIPSLLYETGQSGNRLEVIQKQRWGRRFNKGENVQEQETAGETRCGFSRELI